MKEKNKRLLGDLEAQVAAHGEKIEELKRLLLQRALPLSVREAQVLGVCRICRKSASSGGAFMLECGNEFAHEACLGREADARN